MKSIIVPLVVALLMGLGGASGFSYVSAKKAATVIAAHRADSVAKHVKDSTEAKEKTEKAEKAKIAEEALHVDSAVVMTPADSIRAARHQPTTLRDATHGLPNAADPKHAALPEKAEPKVVAKADAKMTVDPKAKKPDAVGAEPAHAAVPEAVEGALPERRIAKIFGAMQSKDAAKVLEQMNDSDVRVILGMMSDKQAAVILSSFTPQRAAAISKADLPKSDKKTTGVKP